MIANLVAKPSQGQMVKWEWILKPWRITKLSDCCFIVVKNPKKIALVFKIIFDDRFLGKEVVYREDGERLKGAIQQCKTWKASVIGLTMLARGKSHARILRRSETRVKK